MTLVRAISSHGFALKTTSCGEWPEIVWGPRKDQLALLLSRSNRKEIRETRAKSI